MTGHVKVNSSNIESIAYDAPSQTLAVIFKSDIKHEHQYQGVTTHDYMSLMSSPSKGSYISKNIVKGDYAHTKGEAGNVDDQ